MERRNLLAGVVVLALSVFMLAGTASAQKTKVRPAAEGAQGCVVHSLPSFMDQGEEGLKHAGVPSSVADVIEVECEHTGKLQYDGEVTISDLELENRCRKNGGYVDWYRSDGEEFEGPVHIPVALDSDGNVTVALVATNCRPGETTIVADETEYPFETYMTTYTVLPPEPTEEGVWAMPSKAVESGPNSSVDTSSSVVTIIQVEFPVVETPIDINAEQLYDRCDKSDVWVSSEGGHRLAENTGRLESEIETDNDGNAFVLLFGSKSCQPGDVKIFADLEEAESFQTVHNTFEIEYPKPTI